MINQPPQVHDGEPNPSMSVEALAAKDAIRTIQTVCKALGWKSEPSSDSIYHVYVQAHLDEYRYASVSFVYGQYPHKDRITITASTKNDSSIYRYGESRLSISVSASRPTGQIVKEIQRRFMPQFAEIAKKAEEIQNRHDKYQRDMQACLVRLKGEPLVEAEIANRKINLDLDGMWGDVQYGGDDTVTLEVRYIPTEKAARILEILKETKTSAKEESHVG